MRLIKIPTTSPTGKQGDDYINPAKISKIGLVHYNNQIFTVIDVEGAKFSTWTTLSQEEVINMVGNIY